MLTPIIPIKKNELLLREMQSKFIAIVLKIRINYYKEFLI